MQKVAWVIALLAYFNLAFILWTMLGMSNCNAREACLYYVGYFWFACAGSVLLVIVGSITYMLSRGRTAIDRTLPIAISVLSLSVVGIVLATYLMKD